MNAQNQITTCDRYVPFAHQQEALEGIASALAMQDRCKVYMPCGSGKTMVQLWAAEALLPKVVVLFVPSLALITQTLSEWLKQTIWKQFSCLCVCSDESVANKFTRDYSGELDIPVTTNPLEVRRFLASNTPGVKLIFSTYQSAHRIAEGMDDEMTIDVGIFDEAHKTTGRADKQFSFALSDENIRVRKRISFTATPRYYNITTRDDEGDFTQVFSMDDDEVYGPQAYALSFREAVVRDIICDYRVVISVITSAQVDASSIEHGMVLVDGLKLSAEDVAHQIALARAIERYGVRKIFTFHRLVRDAKHFAATFFRVNRDDTTAAYQTFHVHGGMNAGVRRDSLGTFARVEQAIMANAKCLTEGVDVPAVDMVAFLTRKKSLVDIVQATGRAMRRASGKSCGYIFVPLYLEQFAGESIQDAVNRADFTAVWDILNAMREQDEVLAETLTRLRRKSGHITGESLSGFVDVIGPEVSLHELTAAITSECVIALTPTWEQRYGELIAYKKVYGNCNVLAVWSKNLVLGKWVTLQRRIYSKGKLTSERTRLLEAIGFDWDPLVTQWQERYDELVAYNTDHGDCNIPAAWSKNPSLGTWVFRQREVYSKGKLTPERTRFLEAVGFDWDPLATQWQEHYDELVAYKASHGDCNVPESWSENFVLAQWVSTQRRSYRKGKLSPERIRFLNALGFDWNPEATQWQECYDQLVAYKTAYGDCNVSTTSLENSSLGTWAAYQRHAYRKGKLSPERIRFLNALGFDWDPLVTQWQERYKKLMAYKTAHGDCNVPASRSSENSSLGVWVSGQRRAYRKGKLLPERIRFLNALGFDWNPDATFWQLRYEELAAYKANQGHCKVPRRGSNNSTFVTWISNQRVAYRKGKLSPECINLLNALGFDWNPGRGKK